MPQDALILHPNQPQCVHPRAPQGNRSGLTKDLGSTLPLPADFAHFLEDTTDEQIDDLHPPAPLGHKFPEVTQ